MERKMEEGVEGRRREGEKGERKGRKTSLTYPWASGSSMSTPAPLLFPKSLWGPHRAPSTWFQASRCTCTKMRVDHSGAEASLVSTHQLPRAQCLQSWAAGPGDAVSHGPRLELWRMVWAKAGNNWPSTRDATGGLLLCVPGHHMTCSAHRPPGQLTGESGLLAAWAGAGRASEDTQGHAALSPSLPAP